MTDKEIEQNVREWSENGSWPELFTVTAIESLEALLRTIGELKIENTDRTKERDGAFASLTKECAARCKAEEERECSMDECDKLEEQINKVKAAVEHIESNADRQKEAGYIEWYDAQITSANEIRVALDWSIKK